MTHHCDNLLIHCMDFRLQKPINKWMKEREILGDCDVVSLAGGGGMLAANLNPVGDFLSKQIETSINLHGTRRVFLMNHTDCGAYGGQAAFASSRDEEIRHKRDLSQAAAVIHQKWPRLNIVFVLARIGKEEDVSIEILE